MPTMTAASRTRRPAPATVEPDLDFFVHGVLPLAGDAVAVLGARVAGRLVVLDRAGNALHACDCVVLESVRVCPQGVLHYVERPEIPSPWGPLPAAERKVRFDPR